MTTTSTISQAEADSQPIDRPVELLPQETITALLRVGAISHIKAIYLDGEWQLRFENADRLCSARTRRGHIRTFTRMKSLVAYIERIGATTLDIDVRGIAPGSPIT